MIAPPPDVPSGPGRGGDDRARRGRRGPHNRRWLAVLLLSPAVVVIVVLLAVLTNGPPEPSVTPASVPAGYRAISDAYFGYAIPARWQENNAYTDANGDYFYQGTGDWVGENLRIRAQAPVPGTDAPAQLGTFGQTDPLPYTLGPARPVTVPGVTDAYAYDVTRPNGFRATALEVWEGSSQTEMWILVKADPTITRKILTSLTGFRAP